MEDVLQGCGDACWSFCTVAKAVESVFRWNCVHTFIVLLLMFVNKKNLCKIKKKFKKCFIKTNNVKSFRHLSMDKITANKLSVLPIISGRV